MNSSYTQALETKARWKTWLERNASNPKQVPGDARGIVPAYQTSLESRDTHFMNAKFCDLVDHARMSVPDDLTFDISWTHDRTGWMFLEKPFKTPAFHINADLIAKAKKNRLHPETSIDVQISAVGWIPIGGVEVLPNGRRFGTFGSEGTARAGTSFLLFHDLSDGGFGMWSYFTLVHGDQVLERIHNFEDTSEKEGGAYANDRASDMLHEIRWIYTAFHLMSQKLAVQVPAKLNRAQRKRAQREGREPENVKVISLRRLEQAREQAEREHREIDWKWQWEVRGHWRNQWYAAAGEHRQVFIDAYIKGPEDKPLKDPGQKLFVAVR